MRHHTQDYSQHQHVDCGGGLPGEGSAIFLVKANHPSGSVDLCVAHAAAETLGCTAA